MLALPARGARAAIEQRVAAWTLLPLNHQEGPQVLRYSRTQKYDAHWVRPRSGAAAHAG